MTIRISIKTLDKLKKGKKNIVSSGFEGLLLKNGKKGLSNKIFLDTFRYPCIKLSKRFPHTMIKTLKTLFFSYEVRTRTRGKRTLIIPYLAKRKRIKYLTMRGIIQEMRKTKLTSSFSQKLAYEITRVLLNRPSSILKNMKETTKDVYKYRAYLTYRW